MTLTETDYLTISNALRVAAERFREHANSGIADERLKQQFARQAEAAEMLYVRLADETGACS